MKRLAVWALSVFAVFGAPLAAQSPRSAEGFDQKASESEAIAQFWSFAECTARVNTADAQKLLNHIQWREADNNRAAKFALSKTKCLGPLLRPTALSFKPDLLHGALASYFLTRQYDDGNFPDFSATPYQFDAAYVDRFKEPKDRLRALQLSVSECTFRNAPAQVIAFLDSKPMSAEEGSAIGALMPYLSACLQLGNDDKITLSKTLLRSYLGQAGYAVNLAYSTGAKHSLLAAEPSG
ncbi:hypothetical protein GRI39_13430 [Altererythrobacter indicus]|uniref:Uncharacterized protein n=1 Tax=Altericroceibacterium indicum TaxID=374177 RepID=A0A845ACA6_9SPHN|nr:hypothetical protein [Altericroceibacterium indicum]MXP27029.1 hypothetical protein [Altericroceibacterium indicum]